MKPKFRLYFPGNLEEGKSFKLEKKQSHYLKNVVRLKSGDKISLFNSENGEWDSIIISHLKDSTEIKVKKMSISKKNDNNLWLAFSPIKKINQDMMLQKTTELGIQKFLPVLCERSVVREINIERAEKIVIEATEQSNRISVPKISKIQKLNNFLEKFANDGNIIFCDINSTLLTIDKKLSKEKPTCILIGPEGDFSETERKLITGHKKVLSFSLSHNILRSETAAIAATTILSFKLNFN